MKGCRRVLTGGVGVQDERGEDDRLRGSIGETHRARIVPRETTPVLKEARDALQVLVVAFPFFAAARLCYDDPAHGEACRAALRAANSQLVILEGDLAWPPSITPQPRRRRA